ncbi:MAG: DUF4169 domain-containing protein [Pseudomonadota bacterium]
MSKVVNLRQARKLRARAKKRASTDAKTDPARAAEKARHAKDKARHEGGRLDPDA